MIRIGPKAFGITGLALAMYASQIDRRRCRSVEERQRGPAFQLLGLRGIALAALMIALGVSAGCGNQTEKVRYRVTAVVEVDGKTYQSSAVRQTNFTHTPNSLTGFRMGIKDSGEAVAIDAGNGRGIYMLLNDRSGSKVTPFIVLECFEVDSGRNPEWMKALKAIAVGAKCFLTPGGTETFMPLVVAFRDEAVPKSIFEVTPQAYRDVFGVEARFSHLELERVDGSTPLTAAIDKRLPWLNEIPFEGYSRRVLDPTGPFGPMSSARLAQRVSDLYFRDQ